MAKIQATYLLAAGGDFTTALTLGQGYPKQINGQPVAYFWADGIKTGNYVHPTKGFRLAVDTKSIDGWVNAFREMRANGVQVPVNTDHSEKARDCLGYVVEAKRHDDSLKLLHQFIGQEAIGLASRNKVSLGIDPTFKDGTGKSYGSAIVHSALTPFPVVPGQAGFVQAFSRAAAEQDVLYLAAADIGADMADHSLPCSEETLSHLHDNVPGLKDAPDEEKLARVAQHLKTLAPRTMLSAAEAKVKALETDKTTWATEKGTLEGKVQELSRHVPKPMDDEVLALVLDASTSKLDAALSRYDPPTREAMSKLLIKDGDKVNMFALSRSSTPAGNASLVMAIADVLAKAKIITTGSVTGAQLQTMSRHIPDDTTSASEKKKEEAEAMMQKYLATA